MLSQGYALRKKSERIYMFSFPKAASFISKK